MSVRNLTTEKIAAWQKQLTEQPLRRRGKLIPIDPKGRDTLRKRKATANRILSVLKAALNHAWKNGRIESREAWERVKPFRAVDVPKERFLGAAECARLLDACDVDFRDLVKAALLTGCRYGELIRMRVQDYIADAGVVWVRESKSGKSRHVPLTEEGRECFARWAEEKTSGRADAQAERRTTLGEGEGPPNPPDEGCQQGRKDRAARDVPRPSEYLRFPAGSTRRVATGDCGHPGACGYPHGRTALCPPDGFLRGPNHPCESSEIRRR